MYGNDGDDHYYVDNVGEEIYDSSGYDTVHINTITSGTYTIPDTLEAAILVDDSRTNWVMEMI